LSATLKLGESETHALFDQLVEAGLLDSSRTSLTAEGTRVQRGFTDAVAELAERLYGDLPAEEREIAARALVRVTAKVNAEFADR
jgi:DNA-binding MarR family transcriptional regulator